MCKEMSVILVNRVVDPKRIHNWKNMEGPGVGEAQRVADPLKNRFVSGAREGRRPPQVLRPPHPLAQLRGDGRLRRKLPRAGEERPRIRKRVEAAPGRQRTSPAAGTVFQKPVTQLRVQKFSVTQNASDTELNSCIQG
jgi:hypothetical protein